MEDLGQVVVEAAAESGSNTRPMRQENTPEVERLLEARREELEPLRRKQLAKDLWRALRRQRHQRRDKEIADVAERKQGLKGLQRVVQKHAGTDCRSEVNHKKGILVTDSDGIAEVSAQFYEDLYALGPGEGQEQEDELTGVLRPVTVEELTLALKRLQRGRTGAEDGLVAEMLKTGHAGLVQTMAAYFTDILAGKMYPPAAGKVARLSVIFKKGDAREPRNCRPISIIPVMAKVFSVVLYCRIRDAMESLFTEEQFGFGRGRGRDDVNHILRLVVEKSSEWGEELWMATLDLAKAFDKLYHHELFAVLLTSGVDMSAVAVLRKLYRGMQAYVKLCPGVESRCFEVRRGVRQGDPLSPVLFNLVLSRVLQEVESVWQRRGYGTNVGQDLRERDLLM